jgi:hypothetical protein
VSCVRVHGPSPFPHPLPLHSSAGTDVFAWSCVCIVWILFHCMFDTVSCLNIW